MCLCAIEVGQQIWGIRTYPPFCWSSPTTCICMMSLALDIGAKQVWHWCGMHSCWVLNFSAGSRVLWPTTIQVAHGGNLPAEHFLDETRSIFEHFYSVLPVVVVIKLLCPASHEQFFFFFLFASGHQENSTRSGWTSGNPIATVGKLAEHAV